MRLVKIYSQTCGPCKALDKILNNANIEHENIDIDSQEGEEMIEKYGIRAVPTLLLLDEEGNMLNKHVGVLNAGDLKKFANNESDY